MPNSSATPGSGEPSALYEPAELGKDRWEQAGCRLLAKLTGECSSVVPTLIARLSVPTLRVAEL